MAGPPRPRMAVRELGEVRYRQCAVTARATTNRPWTSAMPPKVASPGSLPSERQPGRDQPAYSRVRTSTARAASGSLRTRARSSLRSSLFSLRPLRHTTQTMTTAPTRSATCRLQPTTSRKAEPPGRRSCRAAEAPTAAATVSRPAAVWAARSRASRRRPYQKPGLPSAVRLVSSSGSGWWGSGCWDSYALQVRWERYQRRPVRAPGSRAARARRRPGCDHQPPWPSSSVARKPSQARSAAHAGVPAHCQAVRSSATSQAAATSSTIRVSPVSRTRSPYVRTRCRRWREVGRIQWARLTTMKGSSRSHRAREPLPEVRLHQTYASGTGLPR